MSLHERRKKDIREMTKDIEDHEKNRFMKQYPLTPKDAFDTSSVSPEIIKKKLPTPEEILATKKLEIPKCLLIPVNGRIYLIEVASSELRSPGGLILPQKLAVKKNDQMADIKRYFVVTWDPDGIPQEIQNRLQLGIEVNPFLPEHAEEWDLPRVIDWQGGNVFKVAHYTELAGISSVKPEIVE
jgi:hypothetical protein